MATIRLPPDFREFLRLLNSHAAEYLLVGGYSVELHECGSHASSVLFAWSDPDIHVAGRSRIPVVSGFGDSNLSVDLFLKQDQVIRMGVPPLRIDILTSVSGVGFSECYAQRSVDQIDGVDVSIIGLADLKRNKRSAGRHKDLNDLENLP